MSGFLKKVFNVNEREIKRLEKKIKKINEWEENIEELTDEQLKNKTFEFKERLHKGENLENLLYEAFAVVREASKRVLGMRHYDVQLIGGIVLHEGNISEMRTGEGKTLVSTLPAYLNALTGRGVHIVTVNEYLAERDSAEMGQIYRFLGLTVGLNLNHMNPEEKREAYNCDITYGTNSEFGFDYLRDNMVVYKEELVQKPLHYAIVDEVDSILIDEARTPLIISGQAKKSMELYGVAAHFANGLKKEEDYTVDEKSRSVMLTENGVEKAEKSFQIENLYEEKSMLLNHHIQQALRAKAMMKRDVDYVVQDGEIMIVDEFTGRIMEGRRYSDGLHQAIEAKEGLKVKNESMTLATITLQNYFRMYEKLSGMTGTAKTEEEEFEKIYQLSVVVIPTNKPIKRADLPDRIYRNEEEKYRAIVKEIIEKYKNGQPVLVGTTSIENSEKISDMLKKKGIPHNVLNAKHHEKEAEIVANAGQRGIVTIATNMAGRGTDIKLGEGVKELGGLHIIGTERHESRRIDNQLRGRSGRQGDPGSTQFIISLEDELMRKFGSENLMKMMDRLGVEDDQPIESKMISKAIQSAQKRVEGSNFDTRKHVLEYDDVMNQQRHVIYRQRKEVIENSDVEKIIFNMMESVITKTLDTYYDFDETQEWDMKSFITHVENVFLNPGALKEGELKEKEKEELFHLLLEKTKQFYQEKKKAIPEEIFIEFEKTVLLRAVDSKWMEHIDAMDHMRQGIHLRGYAQTNPLQEYQFEGYQMFNDMISLIEEEVVFRIMKSEIKIEEEIEREKVVEIKTTNTTEKAEIKQARSDKIGRNSPCPCGSGKKYKNCHGN